MGYHCIEGIPAPRNQWYRKFQQNGIRFLAERTSALLADEPGLGKTIQAIGAINYLNAHKILVVCPASVKYNWLQEFKNWLVEFRHIQILEGENAQIGTDSEIIIVNYDLLSRGDKVLRQLVNQRFEVGIFDEAHYLKSHKSNRTLAILRRGGIGSVCRRKWFLTGTPVLNRPIELYPMLKAAAPEVIAPYLTRLEFARQYCGAWWDGLQWVMDGSSNETELRDRMHESFMLRRLKADHLKELPDKAFKIVPIGLSEKNKFKLTQEDIETLEDLEASRVDLNLGGVPIAMHRREVAEAKVERCINYIKDELESVDNLVIFAHHKSVIRSLEIGLAHLDPLVVTGDTPAKLRTQYVKEFQEGEKRVFIGQMQAAGTGITLTKASNVIFVESSWVPGEILQAVDRCHRIGQKNAVQATFLVAQDSIEEYMIHRVVDKMKTINKIVEK